MSKTLLEIRSIARMREAEMLRELTRRELEVLLFELSRTQYALMEQEAYVRFYMAVIEAIQDCRVAGNFADGQL